MTINQQLHASATHAKGADKNCPVCDHKPQSINLSEVSLPALQMLINNVSGLTDEALAQYYLPSNNLNTNAHTALIAVLVERNERSNKRTRVESKNEGTTQKQLNDLQHRIDAAYDCDDPKLAARLEAEYKHAEGTHYPPQDVHQNEID